MLILRIIILLLTIFILPVGTKNARAASENIKHITLNIKNTPREYILYTPDSLQNNTKKRAVVMVMHGGGGTAKFAMREVGKTLFKLAERDRFYVIFPSAINKMWDFGMGRVSQKLEPRVDDRSYFQAILDNIATHVPINPKRIFVTGISRGGQASYYIACQFPKRIRAIATVAMPLPVFLTNSCKNSPPLGVLIINGTKDPLVPYEGGTISIGKDKRDDVLSTDATIQFWKNRNGCNAQGSTMNKINSALDWMHVEKTEWRQCSGDPVVLYRIVGGGHTWPSGKQYLPAFLVGRVNRDIDASKVIWNFFREFR